MCYVVIALVENDWKLDELWYFFRATIAVLFACHCHVRATNNHVNWRDDSSPSYVSFIISIWLLVDT